MELQRKAQEEKIDNLVSTKARFNGDTGVGSKRTRGDPDTNLEFSDQEDIHTQ